jgi:activating signal cointegrator complex subunit 3
VITRKAGSGDGSLSSMVKLLIIDEVHLLHEDRGAVIETIVARTLRQVETSQSMIRIVGLSATLPNFQDVAEFLHVNPKSGLLVFDGSHRPVPLEQTYIGVSDANTNRRNRAMTAVCYDYVRKSVDNSHQVMVFVHSRKDTMRTAQDLTELGLDCRPEILAKRMEEKKTGSEKQKKQMDAHAQKLEAALHKMRRSNNVELKKLFELGIGIHHAGMVRSDRTLVESLFAQGVIRVLCCTATLAWGVNLPAHTVIIKGTQIYDTSRGGWVDVGMLDVMQIFGRAGRPQFDTSGEGIIITSGEKLPMYLALLTHQHPIESQFVTSLPDNLNAEIILGTVTNLKEALAWLGYTYLNIRLAKSPQKYGVPYSELENDPSLFGFRKKMITEAAKKLMACKMIRFDSKSGNFFSTELGRICSHYYIHHETAMTYNENLHPNMTDEEIFHLLAMSKEFDQVQTREDEQKELNQFLNDQCFVDVIGSPVQNFGKTNILMQAYLSRAKVTTSSLISDTYYIQQNIGRICRAVFQVSIHFV